MTQTFVRAPRTPDRRITTHKTCCVGDCNSSGLYRWMLLEHQAGRVCGKHKAEFERIWQRETRRA